MRFVIDPGSGHPVLAVQPDLVDCDSLTLHVPDDDDLALQMMGSPVALDPAVDAVDTDVLVLADDRMAADTVIALAGRIPGMRGIFAGRLRNAGQVEAMTANLIAINRRYKTHSSIRVSGV